MSAASTHATPAGGRIDDIEVLRAIAVIFVCVEHMHMNLFAWVGGEAHRILFGWTGMWSGVDLFFVISGFVIARDLIPRISGARSTHERLVTTLAFWIRRAWRLIPSAWLWLAVILVACVFFDRSGAWGSLRANLEGALAAVFNVANLRAMLVYGKFEPGATFPYWSLSLEEQFYLVLPFLIWLSGKRLALVLGAVVLLQLLLPRTPLGTIIRTDALALGVLIAIWSRTTSYRLFEPRFMAARAWRVVLVSILAGGLAFAGGEDLHVPVPISLVAYIGAVLVFIASYDRNYIMAPGWIRSVFLWVGTRSYAIYLIHIPAYFATREIWFRRMPEGIGFDPGFTPEFLATALVLLLVFAELNYRFVEIPLRRRGAEIAARFRAAHALD
ncbi:MAG: O-acetyltransferase OatA [Pseudomonadales bacterium]|nr:O-acetyltransferase OatA [Pseudomonadales bacterium]